MIWISLLHRSLFLGVSSKRHIFTASFSFVSYKTDKTLNVCYVVVLFLNDCVLFCGVASTIKIQTSVIRPIFQSYCSHTTVAIVCAVSVVNLPGAGRGKHGQTRPFPASLWAPSPRSSGSAWREVSPSLKESGMSCWGGDIDVKYPKKKDL